MYSLLLPLGFDCPDSLVVGQRLDHLPVDVVGSRLLQHTHAAHLHLGHLPEALMLHQRLAHLPAQQQVHALQGVFIHLKTSWTDQRQSASSTAHFQKRHKYVLNTYWRSCNV